MEKVKTSFQKLFQLIARPEMRILPGNLAFFLVLSAIPIITLIGFIASQFSISIDSVIHFMQDTMPQAVTDLLLPFIDGKGGDANVWIFMITGFFLASNGAHSIIIASNLLYHIPDENVVKRRIKAMFMTILLVFLFIFIIVVLAFGNVILKIIIEYGILKNVSDQIYFLFAIFKWPIAFLLIFIVVKLIYTIAPDFSIPSKYVNRGAMFTTLGWSIVTAVYSFYVSHFANYDIFYGGVSNIIVLMMWLYILSYILVIGIAINTATYKKLEKNSDHKTTS